MERQREDGRRRVPVAPMQALKRPLQPVKPFGVTSEVSGWSHCHLSAALTAGHVSPVLCNRMSFR